MAWNGDWLWGRALSARRCHRLGATAVTARVELTVDVGLCQLSDTLVTGMVELKRGLSRAETGTGAVPGAYTRSLQSSTLGPSGTHRSRL
jgi:hypothetical protein